MPKMNKKVRLIHEILNHRFVEEAHPEYVRFYNEFIEVLKQKSYYVVVDRRQIGLTKLYNNLETAHKHIVKCHI